MATDFRGQLTLPLGLRNNNPGNIRPGDSWRGMVGIYKNFVVFKSIDYGIRAMATDIIGDIVNDGKNTIRKLITEYAPPSENNTEAYINSVATFTGWKPDQVIDPTIDNMAKLLRGMMNVELGKRYADMISDKDIIDGLSMVGVSLLSKIKNFFVENSNVRAALEVGLIAALIVALAIVFRSFIKKFFNGH